MIHNHQKATTLTCFLPYKFLFFGQRCLNIECYYNHLSRITRVYNHLSSWLRSSSWRHLLQISRYHHGKDQSTGKVFQYWRQGLGRHVTRNQALPTLCSLPVKGSSSHNISYLGLDMISHSVTNHYLKCKSAISGMELIKMSRAAVVRRPPHAGTDVTL